MEKARTELESIGARTVGISVDAREDSVALIAKLGLHFPLLSDADLRVAAAYGVAMEGRDIAVPAVFVVARDGTITWKRVGESITDRPSAALVLAKAREAGGR
ncbi:MAG: redoxin domain-containing protein [Myxococcales bacterium]|nr:redoxin domain-containing protein [Myxococcales bacterium]